MKVNKIVNPAIKNTLESGVKKAEKVIENPIREFDDKVGDIAGRTHVLLNSQKEITMQELAKIKAELKQKMINRGFSQNNIDYILSYTKKHNYEVTQAFVDDMYAHTSQICWAVPYTTPRNAHLMKDAVLKKNYKAIYAIESGNITDVSQIKDMRQEVIENGRVYEPIRKTTVAINNSEFKKERRAILDEFKSRGMDLEAARYDYCINEESIEVAKAILEDKKVGKDKNFILWVLPYTNSENAEHMLRAILNKDYRAVYQIENGIIREFDTLDARYALLKRFQGQEMNDHVKIGDTLYWVKDKAEVLMSFARDDISAATKVLFEDTFYDFDIITKIIGHINKNNVKEFKEALLNRDIAELERLCGKKLSAKELSLPKKEVKQEFKTTSQTGKISREDFVGYIDNKLLHTKAFNVNSLKDSEVRNLAKLFGVKEEQILNMDKKSYRQLCLKFHPDKNPNDKLATEIFRILNNIFQGQ